MNALDRRKEWLDKTQYVLMVVSVVAALVSVASALVAITLAAGVLVG